jgi:WD40 repeat protein
VATAGVVKDQIEVHDIASGKVVRALENAIDDAQSMAFDPSGQFLAAVSKRLGVGVWHVETGNPVQPDLLSKANDYYWCVRFHPDGEHIALGLWSGFVEIIHLQTGEYRLSQDTSPHHGRVHDLALTRDGKHMFTAGGDGVVLVWDLV